MSVQSFIRRPMFWAVMLALVAPVSMFTYAADDDQPLAGPPTTQGERGPRREGFRGGGPGRGGDQGPGGPGGGMPMRQLLRDLDLSEDQGQQIRSIMQEAQQQHRQAMEQHREEIEKIDEQIRELHERKRELLGGGPQGVMDQIKDVLNDEQRATFEQRLEEMRDRRGPGPGGPQMDGDGPPRRGARDGGGEMDDDAPRQRGPRDGGRRRGGDRDSDTLEF